MSENFGKLKPYVKRQWDPKHGKRGTTKFFCLFCDEWRDRFDGPKSSLTMHFRTHPREVAHKIQEIMEAEMTAKESEDAAIVTEIDRLREIIATKEIELDRLRQITAANYIELNRLRQITAAKDIELNQLREVNDDTLLRESVISRVIELGRKEPLDVNGILSLAYPGIPITDQSSTQDANVAFLWLKRTVDGNEEAHRIIETTLGSDENWPERWNDS